MRDVLFAMHGDCVHVGYSHPLFAALCNHVDLHNRPEIMVGPITGVRSLGSGILKLRDASITIRCPDECVDEVARGYAHADMMVGGHRVTLGKPSIRVLRPSPVLHAELVTFAFCKGGNAGSGKPRSGYDWQRWIAAVQHQVEDLGDVRMQIGRVRRLPIGKRFAIGHPLQIGGLSPSASLLLQSRGMGGRRHMGGGVFLAGPLPKGLQ